MAQGNLLLCRCCLISNVPLNAFTPKSSKSFTDFMGYPPIRPDESLSFLCIRCEYLIQKLAEFKQKCVRADNILKRKMLWSNQKPISISDFERRNLGIKLISTKPETISYQPPKKFLLLTETLHLDIPGDNCNDMNNFREGVLNTEYILSSTPPVEDFRNNVTENIHAIEKSNVYFRNNISDIAPEILFQQPTAIINQIITPIGNNLIEINPVDMGICENLPENDLNVGEIVLQDVNETSDEFDNNDENELEDTKDLIIKEENLIHPVDDEELNVSETINKPIETNIENRQQSSETSSSETDSSSDSDSDSDSTDSDNEKTNNLDKKAIHSTNNDSGEDVEEIMDIKDEIIKEENLIHDVEDEYDNINSTSDNTLIENKDICDTITNNNNRTLSENNGTINSKSVTKKAELITNEKSQLKTACIVIDLEEGNDDNATNVNELEFVGIQDNSVLNNKNCQKSSSYSLNMLGSKFPDIDLTIDDDQESVPSETIKTTRQTETDDILMKNTDAIETKITQDVTANKQNHMVTNKNAMKQGLDRLVTNKENNDIETGKRIADVVIIDNVADAIAPNETATNAIKTNKTATNVVAANKPATNVVAPNKTSIDATESNKTATDTIALNITATNAIAPNKTATNAVAPNKTATDNIYSSSDSDSDDGLPDCLKGLNSDIYRKDKSRTFTISAQKRLPDEVYTNTKKLKKLVEDDVDPINDDDTDVYECTYCTRKFVSDLVRDSHEKVHTHPFKCRVCNERYKTRSQIDKHWKTHYKVVKTKTISKKKK